MYSSRFSRFLGSNLTLSSATRCIFYYWLHLMLLTKVPLLLPVSRRKNCPVWNINSACGFDSTLKRELTNICQMVLAQARVTDAPICPRKRTFAIAWVGTKLDTNIHIYVCNLFANNLEVSNDWVIKHTLNCPWHQYGSIYHWIHNWAPHCLVYSKVYVDMENLFSF